MKRMVIAIVLLLPPIFAGCSAKYSESWFGPSGKATPVCDQATPGLGFTVGDKEFIPVGYYTWTDVHRNEHRELVFVLRPKSGGAK